MSKQLELESDFLNLEILEEVSDEYSWEDQEITDGEQCPIGHD